MNILRWLFSTRNRLDIVAGLIDGVLNALTLAAARLYSGSGQISFALVVKVGAATAFTTIFVFFVAHYAQLRAELVHSARELNLTSRGHLAATKLGRQIAFESFIGAVIAAVCGLFGASVPLVLRAALPAPPAVSLGLTIALLGILGISLARGVSGSPWLWALSLMLGGIAITALGIKLDIVG